MTQRFELLAIEPYFGGSHRAFLESARSLSQHAWTLVTMPARHWKWRMRSAPLPLVEQTRSLASESTTFDAIVCSDMLDLPTWLGFVAREHSPWAKRLLELPIATYFHESQWDYPIAPAARVDHHYGYTNLLTAAASDVCWFNSDFHRRTFFDSCASFLRRMPDTQTQHDLDAIRGKSIVIPPGFNPVTPSKTDANQADEIDFSNRPLRIGWVSRWEHDKRPDQFVKLLDAITARGIDFQLILLGQRRGNETALTEINHRFGDRIVVNEYAQTRGDYARFLSMMDVVVSTADHEFFGIGVCEAIEAGAAPVLPNRLSYPELFPANRCYGDTDGAAEMVIAFCDPKKRRAATSAAKESLRGLTTTKCVAKLDAEIANLIAAHKR